MKVPTTGKIFITDNDGVIFDRMPIYRNIFVDLTYSYGVSKKIAADYFYNSAGTNVDEQFSEIFEQSEIKVNNKIIKTIIVPKFFKIAKTKKSPLFNEADMVLKSIKDRGYLIYVTSGSNTD